MLFMSSIEQLWIMCTGEVNYLSLVYLILSLADVFLTNLC